MTDDEILREYLPEQSVKQVMKWIKQKKVHFKITNGRSSKLGDYRPPIRYSNHRISVNHDLNQYSFLITFVHEMAHLNVWEKYQNRVAPHGIEWKNEYRKLMKVMLKKDIFPHDISDVLANSILNSKASSTSDLELMRVLSKYDESKQGTHLEDLPENIVFETENGRRFKKGAKRRTRYLCTNVNNQKQYLFHPLTIVIQVGTD